MKMPKKLKAKWLKALRSGEYGQAKGRLTDGKGGFCCLGVLQHVASGGKCEVWDEPDAKFMSAPTPKWYRENNILDMHFSEIEGHLMKMNDGVYNTYTSTRARGKSFKTIANYIEKNVEGV